MNKDSIINEGLVKRPFEATIISDELRARVQYFQKLLNQKRKLRATRKIIIKRN